MPKENKIEILVNPKTKELAICRGEYPNQFCKEVNLGRRLTQIEIDKSIMAIELNLDML